MTHFPSDLTLRLAELFTKEEQIILEEAFSQINRPTTLRVNTIKSTAKKIKNELNKAHIGYELCLDIPESLILTNDGDNKKLRDMDIYKNGEIYIQGLASQLPIHHFGLKHSDTQKLRILDACAAPGGKTSGLAAYYPNAKIWAFESSRIRYEKMEYNLKKLGITQVNTICDSIENIGKHFAAEEYFDMVLIDAPCSGEGALSYHNTKFIENWSLRHIKKNYARQKAICDAVLPYLKNGGEMIYSTCTLAPEENEGVIHYLLCKYPELILKKLDFNLNQYIKYKHALKSFGKYTFRKEISECSLRIIPSKYSEGFYIAKLRKCEYKV